ncbi:MAG: RNA polymerase-binding protein DksA [Betaproteobacteria bacterium]|nr:RNA polymerase-binding protein DksA [Betaproteobacteria bacterium]
MEETGVATPKPAAKTASTKKTTAKAAPAKAPATKPVAAKPAAKAAPAKATAKVIPAKPKPAKIAPAPTKATPAKAATASKATGKKTAASVQPAPAPAPAKPVAKTAAKAPAAKTATAPAKPATPMKSAETKPAKPQAAATPAPKTSAKPAAKARKMAVGVPLTDADILTMSDDEYMNEVQLAYFKAKLEAMREEMLENARETGEHLKENEVFADPNDRATVEEENMLEQRVRDRERKLLKKINSTLARIESGDYGYCKETGDPIGIPRLLARPTADLSIEAQEKHERLEKLYAD